MDIAEVGAGGGQDDLDQVSELELDDLPEIQQLIAMAASKLHENPQLKSSLLKYLTQIMMQGGRNIKLDIADFWDELQNNGDEPGSAQDLDNLPLDRLICALARLVSGPPQEKQDFAGTKKHITFPFSRHSSYEELRFLVAAFLPKDIYPCTVDPSTWTPAVSMQTLFGDLCSDTIFHHDATMHALFASCQPNPDNPTQQESQHSTARHTSNSQHNDARHTTQNQGQDTNNDERHIPHASHTTVPPTHEASHTSLARAPHTSATAARTRPTHTTRTTTPLKRPSGPAQGDAVALSSARAKRRREVQDAVLGIGGKEWGGLRSVRGYSNQEPEEEL